MHDNLGGKNKQKHTHTPLNGTESNIPSVAIVVDVELSDGGQDA